MRLGSFSVRLACTFRSGLACCTARDTRLLGIYRGHVVEGRRGKWPRDYSGAGFADIEKGPLLGSKARISRTESVDTGATVWRDWTSALGVLPGMGMRGEGRTERGVMLTLVLRAGLI